MMVCMCICAHVGARKHMWVHAGACGCMRLRCSTTLHALIHEQVCLCYVNVCMCVVVFLDVFV